MAISYVGAVIFEEDRDALLVAVGHRENPAMQGWEEKAHHMTLCMGAPSGEFSDWVGRHVVMKVIAFGSKFFADGTGIAAVQVECAAPSQNSVKHITIAHSKGVKPKQSNEITAWEPVELAIAVRAHVRAVEFSKKSAPSVAAS